MKIKNENTFKRALAILPEYACIGVLILLMVVAGFSSDKFYSSANLLNILKQGAVLTILATGMGFILISGCMDLTVGINMAVCALISVCFQDKLGIGGAIAMAFAAGIAISCFNMFVVYITKGRAMEIMMLTFGLKMAYRGLAQALTGNQTFRVATTDIFAALGKGSTFALPNIMWFMIIVVVIFGIVLSKMKFGRQVTLVGVNAEATRLAGISVNRTRLICFIISGVCCAVAGILLASRTSSVKALSGDNYEMDAVSALVIGGYSIAGGYGSTWRCVVGVYAYTILKNILNLMGADAYVQTVTQGLVLILAVWLDVYLRVKRAGGESK
jgi:ribose transport system permease protein